VAGAGVAPDGKPETAERKTKKWQNREENVNRRSQVDADYLNLQSCVRDLFK